MKIFLRMGLTLIAIMMLFAVMGTAEPLSTRLQDVVNEFGGTIQEEYFLCAQQGVFVVVKPSEDPFDVYGRWFIYYMDDDTVSSLELEAVLSASIEDVWVSEASTMVVLSVWTGGNRREAEGIIPVGIKNGSLYAVGLESPMLDVETEVDSVQRAMLYLVQGRVQSQGVLASMTLLLGMAFPFKT